MKKKLFILFSSFIICSLLFYIYKNSFTVYSPFPLEEESAKYKIVKAQNAYSLNYKKDNVDLSLLIGSTPVDLDQFVEKEVRVTGSYMEAKPYCKGDCSSIGTTKRPVVKIDSIQLAQ